MFNGSLLFLIKIIIFTLGCFGTYYYYKEKWKQERWEELWYNTFATQHYRNKTNPYQVKEKIYFYYSARLTAKNRKYDFCEVGVYSLNKQPPIKNLKAHLNYYDETLDDTDNIVNNKEKDMTTILSTHPSTYNAIRTHSWIYNYQISPDMFEAQSHYRQRYYDRYLECLVFINDIPHEHSVFFRNEPFREFRKMVKYPDIDSDIIDRNIISIINNPNTLVKVRSLSTLYYYDINKRLLVTLSYMPDD